MYNSYQGGPPPGLSQQQQGGSGQNRQPTPGSGSGQWHHHPAQRAQQQQQAGGQAASAAASSGAAAPGRSSAAIPIMRPDGSATTSATTSAATTPTLKKSAPASAATSPRPAPGGLSRAAGAAVFVPKSSNKGNDEGKVGAGAATGGNSNGSAGGGSAGGGATAPTGEFRAMNVNGGGSEAPSASTSAYPSPALNPYARAASGAGSAIFTPASGRGTPTATGYESASGAAGGGGADAMSYEQGYPAHSHTHAQHEGMAAQPPQHPPPPMRPFNPYAHMEQQQQQQQPQHLDLPGAVSAYDDNATSGQSHAARPPVKQPLQYHLSAPPLPHTSNLHPQHLAHHAHFMSPSLREDLFRRNEAINVSAPSPAELGGTQSRPRQPEEVHVYRDLVPLEPDASGGLPFGSRGNPILIGGVPTPLLPRHLLPFNQHGLLTGMGSLSSLPISGSGGPMAPSSALGGYPTEVHRATCTLDGKSYVLRRIVGFNLNRECERALEAVERWRRLRCPGVVNVREAFTSWRWNEASIVFVYDFHPLATTLFAEHLLPKPPRVDARTGRMQAVDTHVGERTLWSYLTQLASALRAVHDHGLAVRCIEPGKVIKTGRNRVRFNCCSILDVLGYDPRDLPSAEQLAQHQAEDLYKLGALILVLACNNSHALANPTASLDHLSRHYSQDLNDAVRWLLTDPSEVEDKTARSLLRQIGPYLAQELEASENYSDLLEESLSKELENARLVRLLCKMGFINERPEYDHDPHWSSTGERYLISMFRDHVFHSVTHSDDFHYRHHHHRGPPKPVLDLSHVLTNLNRLDAGSEDKIMLTSRDEQSCLVVSYKEIKAAIDSAFADLSRHS